MLPIEKNIMQYLEEYAADEPDKLFLHDENGGYTVKELNNAVYNTAVIFLEKGIKKEDNVALTGLRTPEAVIMFLALQYIGAVCVLCDTHENAEDYVRNSGVKITINHFVVNEGNGWLVDGEEIKVDKKKTAEQGGAILSTDYHAPAVIIFTSGSTGVHKGVILSQYNLVNHMRNFHAVGGNEEGDSAIQMLPIFHIFGLTQIIDGIMHRCPLFFPREVTPDYICECVEKYGFTRFGFVPSFALAMADAKKNKGYNTDTLKIAVLAGAYSTKEQFNYIQDTLGMRIVPVYGMSECPGITGAAPDEPAEKRASTVGKILPMTEVKIEDDGEITVKGPSLFVGYVGEEPVDQNEFFRTGDLGYIDEEGFLHITGRKKDIIIRNGNNLSSYAIEKKLLALDFVATAAVVGIASDKCGEVPAAMLTIKQGFEYNEDAVKNSFNKLEIPEVISVVEALPLNASGKIDKLKIKEMLS